MGAAFELLPCRLVASHVRRSGETVAMQAPMQRRAFQVRDEWLQGIEASAAPSSGSSVCRLKTAMVASSAFGRDRRAWFSRPGLAILDRLSLAPLHDRLLVDAKIPAQRREPSSRSFGQALEPMAGQPSSLQR